VSESEAERGKKISNKENKLCFTFDFVVFAVRGRKRDKEEEEKKDVKCSCAPLLALFARV
jgi:hypothetical protein